MRIGKTFKSIEPKARKNSQNIRKFVYDMIEDEFNRDIDAACYAINEAVVRYEDRRDYDAQIYPDSIKRVVLDYHMVTYTHLSAISRYYDIPISLVLLFTRMRDELEKRRSERNGEAEAILDGTRAFVQELEKIEVAFRGSDQDAFSALGHWHFRQCLAAYKAARRESLRNFADEHQSPV